MKKTMPIIGWREWIALPALGVERVKAKVDTGARTSAIHAFRVRSFSREGIDFVSFFLHPIQGRREPEIACEAPVHDVRLIKSSNGQTQERFMISTTVAFGDQEWPVELSLTDRDEMGFRMLLGRTAVRKRFLVDPSRSFTSKKFAPEKKLPRLPEASSLNWSTD